MSAPSIAQIKAAQPPSLWDFFIALPGSSEAQLLYALVIAGTLGMAAHYAVKWLRGEIAGSLWAYLFDDHIRNTLLSFFTYVSVAVGYISAGMFTSDTGEFVGWFNVLAVGFSHGFGIDALANKGERPVWTNAERKKRKG